MSEPLLLRARSPLRPRGAVASTWLRSDVDPFAPLRAFAAENAVTEAELAALEMLLDQLVPGHDEQRAALAALLLAMQVELGRGSSALEIGDGPHYSALVSWLRERAVPVDADAVARSLTAYLAESAALPLRVRLTGVLGDKRPIVLEEGAAYFHYLCAAESAVADALASLVVRHRSRATLPGAAAALRATLVDAPLRDRRGQPITLASEQLRAVQQACCSSLLVLSGGPGTGKTSVVTAILRAFAAAGVAADELLLAAPTGRAAKRMTESVDESLRLLGDGALESDRALAAARVEARTLHRLLGYSRASRSFKHGAAARLPAALVVVDEVSMVDLPLMAALLEALPRQTPFTLVLVGDAEQLPAVGTGDVLRQLTKAPSASSPSLAKAFGRLAPGGDEALMASIATTLAASPKANDASLAASYVRLERPFRQADTAGGRAILALASALGAVDARVGPSSPRSEAGGRSLLSGGVLEDHEPGEVQFDGVAFVEATPGSAQSEFLLARWAEKVAPSVALQQRLAAGLEPGDAETMAALLTWASSARVLCFTHKGAAGEEYVNGRMRELLYRSGAAADFHFPGAPVLVLENDYGAGLFNGDQGVAANLRAGGASPPGELSLEVLFPSSEGTRRLPSGRLARATLCYAMTVHKSQGSEYDHVLVMLPDDDNRLLLREIVYTAVTRAKRSVTIVGRREMLDSALQRSSARTSRLRARVESRLEREAPPKPP